MTHEEILALKLSDLDAKNIVIKAELPGVGEFRIGPESRWVERPPYLTTAEVLAWWNEGEGDPALLRCALVAIKGLPGARPKFSSRAEEESKLAPTPEAAANQKKSDPSKPIVDEVLGDWSGIKVEDFKEPI